jgi:hypothetical protein
MTNNLQNTGGLRALHFTGHPKPWEKTPDIPESIEEQTTALLYQAWNEAEKESLLR